MKKNIVLMGCLILLAVIGFGCVSAAGVGNSTSTDAPTHIVEQQQNTDMIKDSLINTEKTVKEDVNVENDYQGVHTNTCASHSSVSEDMSVQDNSVVVSSKGSSRLNISGPKINGSSLNVKGPNISGNGPVLTLSQKQKDIFHYVKVFIQRPELTLFSLCDIVLDERAYSWEETADIVAQAHNIALHRYQGDGMNVSYELTRQGVWDFMSQDMFLILRHSGRS